MERLRKMCVIFFAFYLTATSFLTMRFNKQELTTLATQPSQKFDKEGVLFLRERQEGFFRRTESEFAPGSTSFFKGFLYNHYILFYNMHCFIEVRVLFLILCVCNNLTIREQCIMPWRLYSRRHCD
jgi:inositol polyphosphate-4-phosphatase